MDTQTTSETPEANPPSADEPLVRVREGRLLGGVATGIARRLDAPLWLIRVGFILLATVGGFGFALYGIAWLSIRDESSEESIATRALRNIDGSAGWIGLALIGGAALIIIDQIGFIRGDIAAAIILGVIGVLLYRGELSFGDKASSTSGGNSPSPKPSSPAASRVGAVSSTAPTVAARVTPARPVKPRPAPSNLGRVTFALGTVVLGAMGITESLSTADFAFRHYVSTAMLIAGLGLLVGSFWGRGRGLIALGVIVTPLVFFSPLGDLDLVGTVGERRVVPASVEDIPAVIDLGMGSLTVDFTDVDFTGQFAATSIDLGIGELNVYVPPGVTVNVMGDLGMGEFILFGESRDGISLDVDRTRAGTSGQLDLVIDGGIGSIEVQDRLPSDPTPPARGETGELTLLALDPLYNLADGAWFVDLTSVINPLSGASSRFELGEGTLVITVPSDRDVVVVADVGEGVLSMFGDESAGSGLSARSGNSANPDLMLEIEVGSGVLIVNQENS